MTPSRENKKAKQYEIYLLVRHIIWRYETPKLVEMYFKRVQ
jgi:hypothetical protein